MTPLEKLKGLLVSACESHHNGNTDIASNLMELAADELSNVNPEDIAAHFHVAESSAADVEPAFVDEADLFDEDDPLQYHGSRLQSILTKVGKPLNNG